MEALKSRVNVWRFFLIFSTLIRCCVPKRMNNYIFLFSSPCVPGASPRIQGHAHVPRRRRGGGVSYALPDAAVRQEEGRHLGGANHRRGRRVLRQEGKNSPSVSSSLLLPLFHYVTPLCNVLFYFFFLFRATS